MGWHKPYNVSGTIHCGERLDDWCNLLRTLLQTDDVGIIGHFTGAFTVAGSSPVALVLSTGFDIHEVFALVPGQRNAWLRFAQQLEEGLTRIGIAYSLVVHERIVNLEELTA